MNDDPYWRVYDHPTDGLVVICLQWPDEYDYEQDRFVSDKLASEADAQALIANMAQFTRHMRQTDAPIVVQEMGLLKDGRLLQGKEFAVEWLMLQVCAALGWRRVT